MTFGRQLIGPLVFPFYWTALKVTLVLLLIPGVIPAVVLGTQAHGRPLAQLGDALTRVAWLSLPALLLVTLFFAAIDFGLRQFGISLRNGAAIGTRGRFHHQLVRRNKCGARARSPASLFNRSSSSGGGITGAFPISSRATPARRCISRPSSTSLHVPILIIMLYSSRPTFDQSRANPDWRWLPPATGLVDESDRACHPSIRSWGRRL